MRIEKRYFTFMNQEVEDEEEAKIAELDEYEDVALAVVRVCENTDCERCPFDNGSRCLFTPPPHSWCLSCDSFHNDDMDMRAKEEGWYK